MPKLFRSRPNRQSSSGWCCGWYLIAGLLAPQLLLQVSSTSTCFRSEPALDVLVDLPHTDLLCILVCSNVVRAMSEVNGTASAYPGNVVFGFSRGVREHRLGNGSSVEMRMLCFCPGLLPEIWPPILKAYRILYHHYTIFEVTLTLLAALRAS